MAMQDLQRRDAVLVSNIATQTASGDGLIFVGHAERYGMVARSGTGRLRRPSSSNELVPENVAGAAAVEVADARDGGAARMRTERNGASPVAVRHDPLLGVVGGW